MVLFAVAGVFSAEVTKAAGNETLIRSPNCGYLLPNFDRPNLSLFEATTGTNAKEANDTLAASAYSRACYGKTQSGSQCHQYPKSSIPWKNKTDVPCPFGGGICKDVGGFEMDTDLIDSHETLGINAKKSDRVQYRKVTTCSILRTKEYSYYYNTSSGDQVQQLVRYNYETPNTENNFTFQYNTNGVVGSYGYTLISFPFRPPTSNLIPALNRTDADITLMFLAPNTVTYKSPVLDPWFKATTPDSLPSPDGKNLTQYLPDFWVGVLACADQFQFHNPANGKSTPLTSTSFLDKDIENLELNEVQMAVTTGLYLTILYSLTYFSVHSQGANSLRASDTLGGSDFFQIGLPDDQWMIEATAMFSVSMARLQQQTMSYATGPTSFHEGLYFVKGVEEICGSQKIRGVSGFSSFSVLGLSIILILGCLLTLTALILDTVIGFIRRKLGWRDHKRLQWAIDQKLQLQRLAFEQAGQGQWTGGTDAVPVTSKDELLGLGLNPNKTHPRLATSGYHIVHPVDELGEAEALTTVASTEKAKVTTVTSLKTAPGSYSIAATSFDEIP